MHKPCVVVPNWNGADYLLACLDSLTRQSLEAHIIVVDNGSTDNSLEILEKYPDIEIIRHSENKGFAGGVNSGIQRAIELETEYIALFNNDAVADKDWLKHLLIAIKRSDNIGIATCKILDSKGKQLDSTGDYYTNWGLPYPRGRGEADRAQYDQAIEVFGASGGASLYKANLFKDIGVFDEDFFAYYEDVDISFRTQLAGWKVHYVPDAVAYHHIGGTSKKMKNFATYQTMKNLQLLYYKNVPRRFLWKVGWRLSLAESLFILRAFTRSQGWAAVRGDIMGSSLLLKKHRERSRIQKAKKVSDKYIWDLIVHDLPPNAHGLRKLRSIKWKVFRRQGR